MTLRWRVAILDSGWGGVVIAAASFVAEGPHVTTQPLHADRLGHGTRVCDIVAGAAVRPELLVGQVLDYRGLSTAAVVAAAIRWAVDGDAHLIHLSLGLAADRRILRESVAAAIEAGSIIVAAAPARGQTVFPAGYPGVLQGTGDARCSAEQLSYLGPGRFGGAARFGTSGGSSIGAAHVTRAIVNHCTPGSNAHVVETTLAQISSFRGPESRRS